MGWGNFAKKEMSGLRLRGYVARAQRMNWAEADRGRVVCVARHGRIFQVLGGRGLWKEARELLLISY